MNTKKTSREMSLAMIYRLPSKTNLQFLDYFYLPLWVAVALFFGLSVVAKPVNAESAGAVDIQHYMKSEAKESSAGKASQNPKDSTNDTGAKKTNPEGHGVNSSKGSTAENAKQPIKEASGAKDKEAGKTNPGGLSNNLNENTSPKNTDSSAEKSSTEKCAKGTDKTTSGIQKTSSGENQASTENAGQEPKKPSVVDVKESNAQSSASDSDSQVTDTDQKTQQMPLLGTDTKAEKSSSGDQQAQVDPKNDPVDKPADGKGKLPFFAQADVNGDHYITKDELQNFPYLLQVFDKVDAGKDGKLEQHEYQSLKIETKREAEIR